MSNLHNIIESLNQVNESLKLGDNIDKKKFDALEKKLNKAGFTFRDFMVYKLKGTNTVSKLITVGRINDKDKIMPSISSDPVKGVFYVHPAFMGDLSLDEARDYALNIDNAADIVEMLNKEKFESYMTADAPTNLK